MPAASFKGEKSMTRSVAIASRDEVRYTLADPEERGFMAEYQLRPPTPPTEERIKDLLQEIAGSSNGDGA